MSDEIEAGGAQAESGGGELVTDRAVHLLEDAGELVGRSLSRLVNGARELGGAVPRAGDGSAMDRAEHVATGIGDRLSMATAYAGMKLRGMAARIQEEAEDIRAEAEMRVGRRPPAEAEPSGESREQMQEPAD